MNPETLDLSTLPALALESRKNMPRVSGVYFVRSASGKVLYIGRTTNLYQRWANHHRARQLKSLTGVTVVWLVIDDQAMLDAIEAACIAYYAPTMNGTVAREEGDDNMVLLRIPTDLYNEVAAWAKQDERSINNLLVRIIKNALARRRA